MTIVFLAFYFLDVRHNFTKDELLEHSSTYLKVPKNVKNEIVLRSPRKIITVLHKLELMG